MNWLRLALDLSSPRLEQAERLLESLGALTVTITDAGDRPMLEPDPGTTPVWPECRLEALFEPDTDPRALQWALSEASLPAAELDLLDDAGWSNRWQQHAVRCRFGDRLWLVPRSDTSVSGPALRLDPGLAFGSGSHPTTRLCLGWLAEQELRGAAVLDFGCGSGILALAALTLGCERVVAIDHDPQALLATRENAEYNGLLDLRIEIGLPETLADRKFDLVLANLLANPLIELAPILIRAVAEDGQLVMSGVLEGQAEEVAGAYPGIGFEPLRVEADEQGARWVCLAGRRSKEAVRQGKPDAAADTGMAG